jgi:hypothetical protein
VSQVGEQHRGIQESCYLVIWFKVIRKPEYIGFIKDFKGKELIVVGEGINTPNTLYLR